MSKRKHEINQPPAGSWLVPAAAAAVVAAAVISYGRTEERQAAAGSPYYDKAVKDAINGLKTPGAVAAVAEGIPPLPAGLAAEDYYWCENCKEYHKRDAAADGQAPAAVPPAANDAAEIPPLPEGLSASDYYWCANCKAYHARQDGEAQVSPAGWAGVPFPLPQTGLPDP